MSTGSFRELFREVPFMLNYPFILSTLHNLMYKSFLSVILSIEDQSHCYSHCFAIKFDGLHGYS